jgi:tetratricopeptide (TPR) repeat protein
MPAIAQTLLLLATLGSLRESERDQSFTNQDPRHPADSSGPAAAGSRPQLDARVGPGGWTIAPDSIWPAAVVSLIAVALYTGCWYSGLGPVLSARAWIASGKHELFDSGRPASAERDFQRAAAADPWSVEPAELLSQLFYQRAFAPQGNRDEEFGRSLQWQQEAVSRNPRLAGEHRLLGELFLLVFKQSGRRSDAEHAADAFKKAIGLYPNHAFTQSELAEALWKADRPEEARLAAQQANYLDSINKQSGHVDKQLQPDRRDLLSKILGSPEPDPN